MKYVSLFSGIEAATVAWEPLGWEPLLFSEIDEFPSSVLKARFPSVPNLGDITKINWKEAVRDFGRPDIVVGGSPCQSFSIAGSRTGLDGGSGLMWEYVRCVREVKPDWLLWENVPGALSSSHGEDFRCLLESLDALGYGLAWRVLDAQFFGVAQRRERLFLVGRLGDPGRACQVLFEPESLSWGTQSSREKRASLAAGAGRGASCAGFKWHVGSTAHGIGFEDEQEPTVDATMPPAVLNLQGSQVDREPKNGPGGKGWCDPDKHGAFTLNTTDRHAVAAFAANQRGEVRLQGGDGGVCGAIPASQSGKQVQGVLCQYGDVAGALTARGDSSPCADRRPSVVSDGYVVRRLTPRECERLMGFPDDWTKVPYRGKPAEECPDTPRYKAIGNSMAVPVMRWIGERIEAAERGEL